MGELLVNVFVFSVAAIVGFFYCRNIYRLYLSLKIEKYTLLEVIRGVGIFIPFLGIVMGFV